MAEKQRMGLFDLTRKFTQEQEEWIDAFVERLPDTNSICVITYNGGHGAFKDIKFAADIELIAPNNSQGFVLIRDEDIRISEKDVIYAGDIPWFNNMCRKVIEAYTQHLEEYPFEEVFGKEKENEKVL